MVELTSALAAGARVDGYVALVAAARRGNEEAAALLLEVRAAARSFLSVGKTTLTEWLALSEVDRGALDHIAGEARQ